MSMSTNRRVNILVLGGGGRIGSRVLAALAAAPSPTPLARGLALRAPRSHELDLTRMTAPALWLPWLDGAQVLIHVAGVLREEGADTFAAHAAAARALAAAAATCRSLKHVVILSAPGAHPGSSVPWFAARGLVEATLRGIRVPHTIIRAGALYQDGAGSTRRFHPHALTLDWHAATGSLPLTHADDAASAIVRAALMSAPADSTELDVAGWPLAHAA